MISSLAIYTNKTILAAAEVKAGIASKDLSTATTNNMSLEAVVTNSSAAQILHTNLVLSYAFAMTSVVAAPSKLATVGTFNIRIPNGSDEVSISTSLPFTIRAKYIHVWFDHELLSCPCTLSLNAVIVT